MRKMTMSHTAIVAEDRRDDAERQREKRRRDEEDGRPIPRDVADAIGAATAKLCRTKGLLRLEGPVDPSTGRPQARMSANVLLDLAVNHLLGRGFDTKLSLEAVRAFLFHRDTGHIDSSLRRRRLGHPTLRDERLMRERGEDIVIRPPRRTPAPARVVSASKALPRPPADPFE